MNKHILCQYIRTVHVLLSSTDIAFFSFLAQCIYIVSDVLEGRKYSNMYMYMYAIQRKLV